MLITGNAIVLVAGLRETFVSLLDSNTFRKLVQNMSKIDPRDKMCLHLVFLGLTDLGG